MAPRKIDWKARNAAAGYPTGRRTRRTRGNFQLRTALQKRIDETASTIDKNRLRLRALRPTEPRGIRRRSNESYRNAVYQILLNNPAFVNWIMSHNHRVGKVIKNPCWRFPSGPEEAEGFEYNTDVEDEDGEPSALARSGSEIPAPSGSGAGSEESGAASAPGILPPGSESHQPSAAGSEDSDDAAGFSDSGSEPFDDGLSSSAKSQSSNKLSSEKGDADEAELFEDPDPARHRTEADCYACAMKGLIQRYWGGDDPSNPIPHNAPELKRMFGFAERIPLFARLDLQQDPVEFYQHLCDGFRGSTRTALWRDQHTALFTLTTRTERICTLCKHKTLTPPTSSYTFQLSITVPYSVPGTRVIDALSDHFSAETRPLRCTNPDCSSLNRPPGSNPAVIDAPHECTPRIEAAPEHLIVELTIFASEDEDPERTKIDELPLRILQEPLELTDDQICPIIPLNYTLHSILSHDGISPYYGHYVATVSTETGTPTPSQRRYFISDHRREDWDPAAHARSATDNTDMRFTANPQVGKRIEAGRRFHVYLLVYERERVEVGDLDMKRMVRELL
ncbi:hypothetical protein BCR34DRAFT_606507 [Clohesyomyces aquaticus]|uniref:ubiquitinyl hydrolase 1 n=1 Tax=Clohesyomyces aquaticus TaxID=1231657 RepID=A0A1Y1YPC8_9PLEO|nr:hypothetical protein BCR34DRAFT_606507 [Clohesyomyces aquaticus]